MNIELVKGFGNCIFCNETKSSYYFNSKEIEGYICNECVKDLYKQSHYGLITINNYEKQCIEMYKKAIIVCKKDIEMLMEEQFWETENIVERKENEIKDYERKVEELEKKLRDHKS